MPKPLRFPTKLLIGFSDETVEAIDQWRRDQPGIPSRSESIRRLVDLGLKPAGGLLDEYAAARKDMLENWIRQAQALDESTDVYETLLSQGSDKAALADEFYACLAQELEDRVIEIERSRRKKKPRRTPGGAGARLRKER